MPLGELPWVSCCLGELHADRVGHGLQYFMSYTQLVLTVWGLGRKKFIFNWLLSGRLSGKNDITMYRVPVGWGGPGDVGAKVVVGSGGSMPSFYLGNESRVHLATLSFESASFC